MEKRKDAISLTFRFVGEPVEVEPSLRPVRTPDHREPPPEPEIRHAGEKGLKLKRLSDDDDLHPRAESGRERRPKPGRFPAGVDAESSCRAIGLILVSVCQVDGIPKMLDKSLARKEHSGKNRNRNGGHILTSILNGSPDRRRMK